MQLKDAYPSRNQGWRFTASQRRICTITKWLVQQYSVSLRPVNIGYRSLRLALRTSIRRWQKRSLRTRERSYQHGSVRKTTQHSIEQLQTSYRLIGRELTMLLNSYRRLTGQNL